MGVVVEEVGGGKFAVKTGLVTVFTGSALEVVAYTSSKAQQLEDKAANMVEQAKDMGAIRLCKQCGAPFVGQGRAKYCSDYHKLKAHRERGKNAQEV